MNCAFVTIVEQGGAKVQLAPPVEASGSLVDGVVCATVIQHSQEALGELCLRVQRRLALTAKIPGQVRRVVYQVGSDASPRAFSQRTRLCADAMGWLLHCDAGASLHLVVPEPAEQQTRHAFLQLVGELNLGVHSVAISLLFKDATNGPTLERPFHRARAAA